jgi:excisionase family DNA binding protein
MPVSEDLYSVGQVAERLGLHVRTVRNYVRDGRLKAVRIGKQYRIAGEDLAALTGRPVSAFHDTPVRRHRHVEVSSIVEIDAISPETASRMTNLLVAAANSRSGGEQESRVETLYNEERAHLKIIVVGTMDSNSRFFQLVNAVLES